jgi:DNA-binding NarL/FixJ family response regulator
MRKIRVLLADDHTVVRQGLRALLAAEEDIEIVGEAENGRQALQLVKKLLPDVVVMDIAMPVLNGVEATRQITRYVPSVKVLVLSTYSNDEYVEQLTEAGAAGYLVKQTAANDLLKAIREAFKGNAFFSPAIAKRLRDQCRQTYVTGQPVKRRSDYLTTREAEVLQLIAEGRANKGDEQAGHSRRCRAHASRDLQRHHRKQRDWAAASSVKGRAGPFRK